MRVPRFFRNPETSRVVVAQPPNLPLWIYLATVVVRFALRPDGAIATGLTVVASVALAWWAIAEVVDGDSPFRRVLGAVVLAGWLLGLLLTR